MTMEIRPLSDALGAEALGVDLADLDEAGFARLRQALVEHCVLVVRDQARLTPEAHIAFTRRFGEPAVHVKTEFNLPEHPEVLVLSNRKKPDGSPIGFEEAGRYWHSDVSYGDEPVMASLLLAVDIPPKGGDTLYCNMYRAYDSLPDAMKQRIDGRKAVHSYLVGLTGKTAAGAKRVSLSDEQKASLKDTAHPIVRTHPETGRKALFVNPGFTFRLEDEDEETGKALLTDLFEHAARPENVYRHIWRPHDLVMWDNRCTMHHATPYDPQYTRHMHRTTVKGDRPV